MQFCFFYIAILIGICNTINANVNILQDDNFLCGSFPADFEWGVGTASYQVEGAWNEDGKGESIWDRFTHTQPEMIADNSNGDVAANTYHKWREDVQNIKAIGAKFHRFSISWPRVFPRGRGEINPLGLAYYSNFIDELLANDIEPFVTLYHWDLPQALQEEENGWLSDQSPEIFLHYANTMFAIFGGRVKKWLTFNEPWAVCALAYGNGNWAPGIHEPINAPYICAHNILKAHALAYMAYEELFKPHQSGQVGITLDTNMYIPLNATSQADIDAAERYLHFRHGWFAFPIIFGDYSDIMKEQMALKSLPGNSRLPEFNDEWKNLLKGSLDFLGFNHYSTMFTRDDQNSNTGYFADIEAESLWNEDWEESASEWLRVTPFGFRLALNWIRDTYGDDIDIYITENGFTDDGSIGLVDPQQIMYHRLYINEMMKAVNLDGVRVKGYTVWALIDLFEWGEGYTARFGLYRVNFTDPERTRSAKSSAAYIKTVFDDNGFTNDDLCRIDDATTTDGPTTTNTEDENGGSSDVVVTTKVLCILLVLQFIYQYY